VAYKFNPFTGNFDLTGANEALSNLTDTAINKSLIPDINITDRNLGSPSLLWGRIYAATMFDASNIVQIHLQNRHLRDAAGITSVDFANRELETAAGTTALSWSGTNIDINTRKIVNVVDPTAAQDVATKAYADLFIPLTQKAAANGVATLGAGGLIPNSQLPALAITDTFVVASQAAMLALSTAEKGDVAVRTDLNKTFILTADPFSTLGNWQELLTPTDAVTSVNGQTGVVSLTTTNVSEGTNLYYTDTRARTAAVADAINDGTTNIAPSQNAVFDALALKANTTLNNLGTTAINADLLPSANNLRDLGATSNAFKDLYLSGSIIDAGGVSAFTPGSRILRDVAGAASLNLSSTNIAVNGTRKITGVQPATTTGDVVVYEQLRNSTNSVVSIITANTTLTTENMVLCNPIADITVTLPSATATPALPRQIVIKNLSGYIITIAGASQNIDGVASMQLTQIYQSIKLIEYSSQWYIISE
jgi:hypothetical protein